MFLLALWLLYTQHNPTLRMSYAKVPTENDNKITLLKTWVWVIYPFVGYNHVAVLIHRLLDVNNQRMTILAQFDPPETVGFIRRALSFIRAIRGVVRAPMTNNYTYPHGFITVLSFPLQGLNFLTNSVQYDEQTFSQYAVGCNDCRDFAQAVIRVYGEGAENLDVRKEVFNLA